MALTLEDFVDDQPWEDGALLADLEVPDKIDGVRMQRLVTRADKRGDLTVLLSDLHERPTRRPMSTG